MAYVSHSISEVMALADDALALVYVDIGTRVVVEITPNSLDAPGLRAGTEIYLVIKANSVIPVEESGG